MQKMPVDNRTITIVAGGFQDVFIYGRVLTIFEATATAINIALDGEPISAWREGQGIELGEDVWFKQIRFENTGGAASTIQYAVSNHRIVDNRAVVSGELEVDAAGNSVVTPAGIAVSDVAAAIAANTSRREIVLQNNGANDIWIGDANVDAATSRGIKLQPGDVLILATASVLYHRCAAGLASTLSILENDRV